MSPSGPVHLGNLRELMVPHLVAEEIKSRGVACEHILSWDDYDRLRKVPAGLADEFAEHIGRPLTAVPDPCGEHASWAEHFKQPFRRALAELQVEVREISQSEMYAAGAYREQVLHAMRERSTIDQLLGRFRTKPGEPAAEDLGDGVTAVLDDGVAGEEDTATGTGGYFPYRVYCRACGRDSTAITEYQEPVAHYRCDCGHTDTVDLSTDHGGKLVWKVDWPMRWAFEGVLFEAGGNDHSSPGSSFSVGRELVATVFGGNAPVYLPYSFVGVRGMAKMSGSRGGAPTPADALAVIEAPVLRWLYTRRRPNQSITIDFGDEVGRLYDEWDALQRRIDQGSASPTDQALGALSAATGAGPLPQPRRRVAFRTLASIHDVTAGSDEQILRILQQAESGAEELRLADIEPRLTLARQWVATHVPAESRTHIRSELDRELLKSLTDDQRASLDLLLERLPERWNLADLTSVLYAVPKLRAGLAADAAPTPELKVAQREFFILLYQLLVGRDTGPRLPTLLLALGRERTVGLLS